jgi:hypothetical protein
MDVSLLPFIFQNRILKSKYLDNRLFKLRTVFIFEILVSRSSKLDPTLINFMKLFFSVLAKSFDGVLAAAGRSCNCCCEGEAVLDAAGGAVLAA